jgi:tricorn protease-like protein
MSFGVESKGPLAREGALRRLTHDAFADLQPAWSPDERHLVLVTDRFSTNLPSLKAGLYNLALLDVATGTIEPLPTFETSKSINPQWAPDGRRLYFLSDRSGVTNIHGVDPETRELFQAHDERLWASISLPEIRQERNGDWRKAMATLTVSDQFLAA